MGKAADIDVADVVRTTLLQDLGSHVEVAVTAAFVAKYGYTPDEVTLHGDGTWFALVDGKVKETGRV